MGVDETGPEDYLDLVARRREIVKRIEDSGVKPKDALAALAGDLQQTIAFRLSDINDTTIEERPEALVVEKLVKYGVDPHDREKLHTVREAADTLKDL